MKIIFYITLVIFFLLASPKRIFAATCGSGSAGQCAGNSEGSSCGGARGGGICTRLTTRPCCVCYCKTSAGPSPQPTTAPIGWYAPDGTNCNRTNFHVYYALPSCSGKAGFVTEGIFPQSQCSQNGTGNCYLATGNSVSQQSKSLWKQDNQTCAPLPVPVSPANAFDTLFTCRFGTPPSGSINGVVRVNFTNTAQFDRIFVWITDSQVGYVRYYELPKSQIVSGRPLAYSFGNLFPDRKYDIYVKAYDPKGVYLDKVVYQGSCGSPGCRSYPNVSFDFILTFPLPFAGINIGQPGMGGGSVSNLVSNEVFQRMIDMWTKGQITPVQMSLFISQIARVPGLQKGSCDPKVPGGCTL